jgi:hypothetical protein
MHGNSGGKGSSDDSSTFHTCVGYRPEGKKQNGKGEVKVTK